MEGAKQKILEVATALFAEKGFAGVSIRELTVAANVNVSAISYYFGGKDGLYKDVIKRQLSYVDNIFAELETDKKLPTIDKIRKFMEMQVELKSKVPLLGKFMSSEMGNPTPSAGPVILEYILKIQTLLYGFIEEGRKSGEFRSDIDPVYCSIMISAIVNFYFFAKPFEERLLCHHNTYKQITSKSYIINTFDVYLHGILKK